MNTIKGTPRTQASTNNLINILLKSYDITASKGYTIKSDDNGVHVGGVVLTTMATALKLIKHFKNIS